MAKDTATFQDAVCTKQTDRALLIECPEFDGARWIPRSQIDDDSEVYKEGDEGALVISGWFAEKEGLI